MTTTNVDAVISRLGENVATGTSGRAAETLYGGHDKELRQTVITLRSGSELAEHDSPGESTLLVLDGEVELVSPEGSVRGGRGDLLAVPACRHSLRALADASVLLTVVKHVQAQQQ